MSDNMKVVHYSVRSSLMKRVRRVIMQSLFVSVNRSMVASSMMPIRGYMRESMQESRGLWDV